MAARLWRTPWTPRWSLNPARLRHPKLDAAVLAGSFCCGAQPCWTGCALTGLATRKPTLLFSFVGVLLLRFEERRLFSVLFQLPPRIARFSDVFLRRGTRAQCYRESTARRKPQLCACSVCAIHARTDCVTAATGIRPHCASWRIHR